MCLLTNLKSGTSSGQEEDPTDSVFKFDLLPLLVPTDIDLLDSVDVRIGPLGAPLRPAKHKSNIVGAKTSSPTISFVVLDPCGHYYYAIA